MIKLLYTLFLILFIGLFESAVAQTNLGYKIAELNESLGNTELIITEDQGEDVIEYNKHYLERIREIASQKELSLTEFNSKMEALEKERDVFIKKWESKSGS